MSVCLCVCQAYENYSFEELRYASPAVRRAAENLLVRDNNDGTYTASWTPASSGLYDIKVRLDDFDAGKYHNKNCSR